MKRTLHNNRKKSLKKNKRNKTKAKRNKTKAKRNKTKAKNKLSIGGSRCQPPRPSSSPQRCRPKAKNVTCSDKLKTTLKIVDGLKKERDSLLCKVDSLNQKLTICEARNNLKLGYGTSDPWGYTKYTKYGR